MMVINMKKLPLVLSILLSSFQPSLIANTANDIAKGVNKRLKQLSPEFTYKDLAKAMDGETIRAGLASHDKALFIKEGWIRDPYIVLGPDDYYYLTGTTPNRGDPREQTDPLNLGLGKQSIVGTQVQVWRSKDLIDWQDLGIIYDSKKDGFAENKRSKVLWAPEIHWLGDRWALVHCPQQVASFALAPKGSDLKGPWHHLMGDDIGRRHDPSLFNDDGQWYMLSGNTDVQKLSADFSQYTGPLTRIDPAGYRINPVNGKKITEIGHEGATIRKIGSKYVHFGTAWSTDSGRQGSYNLYYATADKIEGPYGQRQFAGRFLGHGTPFQTKDGKWWITAFFNANSKPLNKENVNNKDLSSHAQTINNIGTTIVPLEVKELSNGEIFIRAKDPTYKNPGPDENQKFITH